MRKYIFFVFLVLILSFPVFAHNEKTLDQKVYDCNLADQWTEYTNEVNLENKKAILQKLLTELNSHLSTPPVEQLQNQQEEIFSTLKLHLEELAVCLNQNVQNQEKQKYLEKQIYIQIFNHLEFEKTLSDYKSDQLWKMTKTLFFILIVFIITSIVLAFIYNNAKSRSKKIKAFNSKIIQIQEEERQRLSRELHDTVTQDIRTALLFVRQIQKDNLDSDENKSLIDKIENLETQNLINIRNIIQNLTPTEFETTDLHKLLAEHCNKITLQNKIKCSFFASQDVYFINFSTIKKQNIFRIIQEAITNAIKHSEATEINVLVRRESENSPKILYFISDDGHGFSASDEQDVANQSTHLGINGMKTRAQLIDAELIILSDECGTEIKLAVTEN